MPSWLQPRVRPEIVLGALAALYLLTISVLATQGSYFFVRKSAIVPVFCLGALLSSRFTLFVRDWAVFLGLTFLFDAFRGAIFAAITRFDLPVYMGYAIAAEQALLRGSIMPVLLQDRWLEPGAISWLERLLVVVHASHFVFFLTIGLAVWLLRRETFGRYRAAMLLVMYAGLLIYLLLPTVPPWMAAASYQVIPPVHRVSMGLYNTTVPTLSAALATNPVAAMPSLHAAFPAVCTLIALRVFGRRAAWTAAYTLVSGLSVMYLGEHYLVDVLAGWALGAGVYALVFHTRLAERWSMAAVSTSLPSASRRRAIAAAAAGAAFVLAAEGVGLVKTSIQTRFVPTTTFIERELAGRSPVAKEYARQRRVKDAAVRGR